MELKKSIDIIKSENDLLEVKNNSLISKILTYNIFKNKTISRLLKLLTFFTVLILILFVIILIPSILLASIGWADSGVYYVLVGLIAFIIITIISLLIKFRFLLIILNTIFYIFFLYIFYLFYFK